MKSLETVEFQKRSIADAQREIEGEPQQVIERSWPWMRARTQQNNDVLLNTTLTWLARLPKDVRPMVLAGRLSTDCEQYCRHLAARRPLRRVSGHFGR